MPTSVTSTSRMSAVGAVVGIIILLAGIIAMSQAPTFHPFFILWIIVGVGVVGYHLVNAVSGRAPATTIIESEEESAYSRPVADRLRELDELKRQQLVSETEYEAKRKEILKELKLNYPNFYFQDASFREYGFGATMITIR